MISHGKDIKIFTGNANPKLAADICKIIGTKLGESEVKSFADGEASVSLYETVRGSDVFLVQSILVEHLDGIGHAVAQHVVGIHQQHAGIGVHLGVFLEGIVLGGEHLHPVTSLNKIPSLGKSFTDAIDLFK